MRVEIKISVAYIEAKSASDIICFLVGKYSYKIEQYTK